MSLIKFRHNSPPIFAKRDRQKQIINLVKFSVYLIIIIVLAGVTWYYFVKDNPAVKQKLSKSSHPTISQPLDINSIIVPHHDLVKSQRSELFKKIAPKIQNTQTVILISPNHFNTGSADILTTSKKWQLLNSSIAPNKQRVDKLLKNDFIKEDDVAFSGEHGIANILQDIATFMPKVQIVPIIIKEGVSLDGIQKLANQIKKLADEQTLIISSVDFSHYQPAALAELHDIASIRALTDKNLDATWSNIEVDCPACLYVASKVAEDKKFKFVLENHTNSGILEKSRDAESTTHVFGYYSNVETSGRSSLPEKSTTFIFAGDMMFDRMINHQFLDNKILDIFSSFGNRVFWGTDVSIANLEGPISEQPIIDDITANNLSFNFPPKTVKALSWLHLKTVSLANNHSLNAGAEGLEITKKMLDQSKISYFGHQIQFGDFSVFESKSGDIPVSVIGIDTLVDVPNLELEEKIKSEKSKGQFIIIMPHWGNEYQTTHSLQQEAMAKEWISWGADLIIGSHPHVVQDAQEINNVPVFYSLGNLLFDQTFSKETQEGLIIAGKITKEEIQIIPLPTKQINLKPELVQGDQKTKIIDKYINDLGITDQKSSDTELGSIIIKRKSIKK